MSEYSHDVMLEKLKIALDQRVGADVRYSTDLQKVEDMMTGDMAYRLSAYVLAERLLDTDVTVPFSGPVTVRLSRFKGAWRCLTGRSVETTVTGSVTVPATMWDRFPESDFVPPPSLGAPVHFAQLGSPVWLQDSDNGSRRTDA